MVSVITILVHQVERQNIKIIKSCTRRNNVKI